MVPEFPPYRARRFLDENFNAENHNHVRKVLDTLLQNPPCDFRTAHEWYSTFNEASLAIGETHARLEVESQLDFESQEAESRLRNFDEQILSQLLTHRSQLMTIYLRSPWRNAMHQDEMGLIARDFQNRTRFSGPEIAALQIAENEIIRRYRKFMNQASVTFDGTRVPLSSIVGKLNDPTEETRKQAFLTYWQAITANEETLQSLFSDLLKNRFEQAKVVNARRYTDIAFAELGRLDYGPTDCATLSASIASAVVPLMQELSKRQAKSLNAKVISPWNVTSWPALMPSCDPAQGDLRRLIAATRKITSKIHPAIGALFSRMEKSRLIDVEPNPRKAPGAFCVALQESGMPYIFGNFSCSSKDAFTLVHEFGHAVHAAASAHIENALVRTPSMEFCEVASTGMEIFALNFLDEWWHEPSDAKRARKMHLFNMLSFWPFMAMVDSWQHTVYDDAAYLDPKLRNSAWTALSRRFRPQVDWSQCPEFEGLGWFSRPHLFASPFYYVDYGIAQLGALQLWKKNKASFSEAVNSYLAGLSLGGQRSLSALFAATGLEFDLSERQLSQLAEELRREILEPITYGDSES